MPVSTGVSSLAAPFDLAAEYQNHHSTPLVNGANITATLQALAGRTGANGTLHVQAPNQAWTLYCGPINFGAYPITKFAFLESNSKVTIQLTGTGTTLWDFSNLYELVIGSLTPKVYTDLNLLLRGTWSLSNTGAAGDGYTYLYEGMIRIYGDTYTSTGPMAVRCNTRRCKGTSFQFSNETTKKTDPGGTFYIGGEHDGGVRFGYTTCNICLENLRMIDPFCRYRGWRGVVVNGIGECLKANAEVHTAGVTWANAIGVMYGTMETLYGDQLTPNGGFNDSATEQMSFGTADRPLICKSTDFGWSGPEATELGWQAGVPMAAAWYFNHQGKFDGLPIHAVPENFYMTHEVVVGYGPPRTQLSGQSLAGMYMFTEAGPENDAVPRQVISGTWTLKNVIGGFERTTESHVGKDNSIRLITYRGDGIVPAVLGGTAFPYTSGHIRLSIFDTAEYGQFYDIYIDKSGALDSQFHVRGKGNVISNCTLTGKLTVFAVDAGGTNNVATNLKFLGSAREVIEVQSGGQIDIRNIQAPAGSTIDVQSGGVCRIWNGGSWTTLGTGIHSITSLYLTEPSLIPADIPLLPGGVVLPQVGRPATDITTTGWQPIPPGVTISSVLDESPGSTTDYAIAVATGKTLETRFSAVGTPLPTKRPVVMWKGRGSYVASLRQGSSIEIASWTKNDADWTDHTESLTEAQAAQITDGTDLRFRTVS